MTIQTRPDHPTRYFRLNPTVSLGELEDAVVSIYGPSVIKIDGDDVLPFVASLVHALSKVDQVTLAELSQRTGSPAEDLLPVLEMLVQAKMLVTSTEPMNVQVALASLRTGEQIEQSRIDRRLRSDWIQVCASPTNKLAELITSLMRQQGLSVRTVEEDGAGQPPALRLVISSTHLDGLLTTSNSLALEVRTPWLPVVPYDGDTAWIGPFVVPHQSACLTCFNTRRSANFSDDVMRPALQNIRPLEPVVSHTALTPIDIIQAGIVTNFAFEYITLRDYAPSCMPGGLTTVTANDRGVSMDTRRVYRVPRCRDCSPAADTGFPQVWFHQDEAHA
ncbi:TOMM precursor leader peptide-binding protein [Microbacterium lacticum]